MSKERKHILLLTSWYPNSKQPYLGNFVHQFALALSKRHTVTLLYSDFSTKDKYGMVTETYHAHFHVCRAYIPSTKGVFHKYVASKMGLDYVEKHFPQVDIIHAQIGIRDWYHFLWARKRFHRPMIYTEHGSFFVESQFEKLGRFQKYGLKRLFKFTYENTAVSDFLAKEMRKQTAKKIHVIPNFLPDEWFDFPVNDKPNDNYRFLHVSGMDANKNPEGILEACRILKARKVENWTFTFVTEGDILRFQKWVNENELMDQIQFISPVKHSEMPALYGVHDCFVLNSKRETFSLVNAEALCFGLHLISTPVGFLVENKSEFIDKTPFGSPEKLADYMENALQKRKSSGMKGRVFVEQFREKSVMDMYDRLYESVL